MKINRTMVKNEYRNSYCNRSFDVIDSLPIVGSEYDNGVVSDIYEYRDTDFTGADRAYDEGYYEYYRLDITYYPDTEDEFEDSVFVAVWCEYSFDEDEE
jgi:hypothetical protein